MKSALAKSEKALACYHALLDALDSAGYHSYRLGIPAMGRRPRHDSARVLLDRLKQVCDPDGVLAPGRYGLGAPPGGGATPPD